MATVQAGQPRVGKAFTPGGHKASAARQVFADNLPGATLSQQQNHPGPPGIFGTPGAACRSSHQFHAFAFRQNNRVRHEHDYSP
jgi:hypothetical protein